MAGSNYDEYDNFLSFDRSEKLRENASILEAVLMKKHRIDPNLYLKYDVKRGLRDANGKGVLTGLTEVSDVRAYEMQDGKWLPSEGSLYYQGINVNDIIANLGDRKFGYEEVVYLLLFGKLPSDAELGILTSAITSLQDLGNRFVRDVIMKATGENIMNAMQRTILTLYNYDDDPDDVSPGNVFRQSISLIAKMPLIAVYSYNSYLHFRRDETLFIRSPEEGLSLAENLLLMLRPDGGYTELEAKVLDIALILHAEHGGGNNSSFTTHVVSSSGTDTYSAVAASIGSLKGFRHGGANIKVQNMFDDLKANISDWKDEDQIREYLVNILNKKAFDRSGLIYGIGHAVYTYSDPREVHLKRYAKLLAEEKGCLDEFELYDRVERIGKECIVQNSQMFKPICANVDFYSGFVYTMLGIPRELFTPLFAIARIAGWSAHRLEELINKGKIIRPAYKYVGDHLQYTRMEDR